MTRRQALLLRAFAVWTIFVWVTRVKNIYNDHAPSHGAAFKAVHFSLAIVSVVLAVAAWRVVTAVAGRRAVRSPQDETKAGARL